MEKFVVYGWHVSIFFSKQTFCCLGLASMHISWETDKEAKPPTELREHNSVDSLLSLKVTLFCAKQLVESMW